MFRKVQSHFGTVVRLLRVYLVRACADFGLPAQSDCISNHKRDWFILGLLLAGFSLRAHAVLLLMTALSVPCSCLPGCVSCVVHHVCVVVLENHLYKAKHPFQRGTAGIKQTVVFALYMQPMVTCHTGDLHINMLIQALWINSHNINLFPWSVLYVLFYALLLLKWNMLLICHTLSWLLCIVCQFCLPKSEKEQYEKEQRPETQQEILKRVATSLPLYTRTGAGG